jgi:xylulokinase
MTECLVGVDVGTSSVKALLVGCDGTPHAETAVDYPLHRPRPGHAEHDPEDFAAAAVAAVRGLVGRAPDAAARVRALAVVAQREPAVLLDRRGVPLGPAISWTDRRSAAALEEVCARVGHDRYVAITGLAPTVGSTISSLAWLRRNAPEQLDGAHRLVFAKDYVSERLTGDRASDRSTGGRSGLLEIATCAWSSELCAAAGLDAALLPDNTARPADAVCRLGPDAARLLGLPADAVVARGGGDDPAAALGAGVIAPGTVGAGTGTASGWRIVSVDATPDPSLRTDLAPHVVGDLYIREAVISSTGSSLRWLAEEVAPDLTAAARAAGRNPTADLAALAATVPPGAGGVVFYPYLEGAAMPRFDADASGAFLGVRGGVTRAHLARAVFEGVAYQYPGSVALMRGYGLAIDHLTLVGGEALSPFWNQLKADVLGLEVRVPRIASAAAAGAAMLAGLACGAYAGAEDAAAAVVAEAERYAPDPDAHARYRELLAAYDEAGDALAGAYAALASRA